MKNNCPICHCALSYYEGIYSNQYYSCSNCNFASMVIKDKIIDYSFIIKNIFINVNFSSNKTRIYINDSIIFLNFAQNNLDFSNMDKIYNKVKTWINLS